ncbi:MAG: glutamate--tRNA ligase, partial [Thermoplasmata archaeon]
MDRNIILKFALQNAVEHGGKANSGSVLGKCIAYDPSLKGNINELMIQIKDVIEEVNSKTIEEQKE